ncbi:tetratricopeptide repeat protein [Halobacteriovorax sp. HLS]|uniref:tetratricopeptide repeat protein n=1 Tax=Halobacteriovorax sp. HLS TaxID=2234000 RepID=UPI000FD94189|nr:tetratricopeptide repeat protein [Halobacteriovorax sp. HLS]
MSKKYRVKLLNDRVVGPFLVDQIGELYAKGHIQGNEKCQLFPVGDWVEIKSFKEINSLFAKIAAGQVDNTIKSNPEKTGTFARINKPKSAGAKPKNDDGFQEFQYKKEDASKVDYNALEERYQEDLQEIKEIEEELHHLDEPNEVSEEEDSVEKTVIVNRASLQEDVAEKTVIVTPNPFLNKPKDEPEEIASNESLSEEAEADDEEDSEDEPEEVIVTDEATEFINLKEVMPDIKQVSQQAEKEFELVEIESNKDEIEQKKEETKKIEQAKEEKKKEEKKKKKMKPIVAFAFLAIIAVLMFPEESEKKLEPIRIKVIHPVAADILDEVKSREALVEGVELYSKGTYLSKIQAAAKFRESLHHQYRKNKALGYLVLTYSEIFQNASNEFSAQKKIFNLIEIGKSKVLTDINMAMGSAIFYSSIDKKYTANKILENYIRINKPSVKLLSIYLKVLLNIGNYVEAKKVYDLLIDVKNKEEITYLNLIFYYESNELRDEAQKILTEARTKFPSSIPLLLKLAQYKFEARDVKKFEVVLKAISKLNAGRSPIYYSKFLEYMGILSAIKGDNNNAARLFKSALKIHESDELRSKLSALELGGSNKVEKLILESKILELMKKSSDMVKRKNWEQAFLYAIQASDMDRSYIPAQLLLGDIQVRRGYYEDAIKTFVRMKKEYPLNKKINVALVNAYIKAFKLRDAELELRAIGQSKLGTSYIFSSLQGQYFYRRKFYENAIKKYKDSIKKNPINDQDYYQLAKIYMEHRKYKTAKNLLIKSIALDPVNTTYHSMYANIIYELDGADTAIGYLRNFLKTNKEDPRILGEIAIYYYKNGQTLEFEEYKKRLERLTSTDASFYEFLIYSAELDDRDEDVIKYGKELIKINPGDLDVQIKLGSNLYDKGLYKEALSMFQQILARLESFPKANYFLSKTYLKLRDFKNAEAAALKEIKANPTLEFGYYILGEVYRSQKNYKDAENNFKKSISRNGRYEEALIGMGWIKWKQGYLDQARQYYLKALKGNQNNGEIHRSLGFIYKDIGQSALAIDSFRVYLDLTPAAKDRANIENLMKRLR